jgi:hypothetical protein
MTVGMGERLRLGGASQCVDKPCAASKKSGAYGVAAQNWMLRRLFRKAVEQGSSERRGESYSVPYVEPLSDTRTPLAPLSTACWYREQYIHSAAMVVIVDCREIEEQGSVA